ncbi:irregular chiasm C-roughest protein teiresias [Haematobia irritans]|uniref:irregular chiasm C-roughest protein teiresias n=1 Tax=Haematobia irritans TaxID=7368 RepID=UPI003F4FB23D
MRPTFDRSLYILLFIILIQCISYTQQQNIKPQLHQQHRPAVIAKDLGEEEGTSASITSTSTDTSTLWNRKHTKVNEEYNLRRHTNQQHLQEDQYLDSEEEDVESQERKEKLKENNKSHIQDDTKLKQIKLHKAFYHQQQLQRQQQKLLNQQSLGEIDDVLEDLVNSDEICAKNCKSQTNKNRKDQRASTSSKRPTPYHSPNSKTRTSSNQHHYETNDERYFSAIASSLSSSASKASLNQDYDESDLHTSAFSSPSSTVSSSSTTRNVYKQPSQMPLKNERNAHSNSNKTPAKLSLKALTKKEHQRIHVAHKLQHKEVKTHRESRHKQPGKSSSSSSSHQHESFKYAHENEMDEIKHNIRARRETEESESRQSIEDHGDDKETTVAEEKTSSTTTTSGDIEETSRSETLEPPQDFYLNQTLVKDPILAYSTSSSSLAPTHESVVASPAPQKIKRSHSNVRVPVEVLNTPKEAMVIIDEVEEYEGAAERQHEYAQMGVIGGPDDKSDDYSHDEEPRMLPLRPILPNPYDAEEMSVVYAEQHSEIRLMCEVDLDIATSMWYKNGQVVHAMDRTTRVTDYRFIKEANGALTITNVMLEDDGKWQCEAENTRHYTENARPVKLVVLDRPKSPYLLIDGRRLDAGNIFVPVKENSELNLACISEGGNPRPTLTWEVLLSPGVDRHAQKVSAEVLELEEIKNEKDKNAYKINSGAKSEARLPAVFRAHHNARILCVMEHPTLKIRQNASLLLDVQYTPSFAISRTPGFGYPLREGIEVSLKCDVDSNPPSTPRWQKDDGEPPVPQTGDGFLNFTSIRREHSGWYKCTSRHLNYQYSSIGYYLSVRYDSVDVTSEPDDQDISVAAASHNPNKGQLEVQLGGAVTLQCPQGSLGCWSHLDPVTARLRGLGHGLSSPTGQVSLKDVVYQDAGTYKCIGQSPQNKKKLEVLQTVGVTVKGHPTVVARNNTPVAYPGSPLHLSVEFCANPPAHAARWLHGDRVYTPGNQYGNTVLAYGFTDLPTPFCKEARLTYISMHERVPRTFYFIVSSPGGVAEAVIKVNFTLRYRSLSNVIDEEEEELSEPEEVHFPVFGSSANALELSQRFWWLIALLWLRYKI